jgi:hypothetical protein
MNKFTILVLAGLTIAGCKKHDGGDHGAAKTTELGAKNGGIPTSREGQMYMLGMKLSQAAMINGRTDVDLVQRTFHAASVIADVTLKTKIAPLPAVTHDAASDTAAGMHYLLDEDGKLLAKEIDKQFGPTASASFELAMKINMLPSLYIDDPTDKMGDTMASVLTRLAAETKLDAAVAPLVGKIKARAPMKEVDDLALGMNESLPIAIATIYEKDDKKTVN